MADEKLKIAGLRLKIDGAAEFNRSITSVNSELKLASANLAKVTAEFDKNTPAVERLAAKQQDYTNKLDAARKKGEEYHRLKSSMGKTAMRSCALKHWWRVMKPSRSSCKKP